jgi:hypothetical protein
MILQKIISGGQTGADTGGLIAGKQLGLQTGGWMPKGFQRLDGQHPEFKELYGVFEHASKSYVPRTFSNAAESDGTVRFAADFSSPGELCTLRAIQQYKKPYYDVNVFGRLDHEAFFTWLEEHQIKVLNVAGNAERRSPGICQFVVKYLVTALARNV